MVVLPNAAPQAARVASASATPRAGFSGSTDSRTCGTAHGAYSGDAHMASLSVDASCSCVTLMASPGGGRKDTGKYAATTSYSSSAAAANAARCASEGRFCFRASF